LPICNRQRLGEVKAKGKVETMIEKRLYFSPEGHKMHIKKKGGLVLSSFRNGKKNRETTVRDLNTETFCSNDVFTLIMTSLSRGEV